jgi:hypothetical protein
MSRWTEIPDAGVRSLLATYFGKVDRALAPLSRAEADEVKVELEAHAIEAIRAAGGGEDAARNALGQLGDPENFLPALVADRLRARAGRTFSPADIALALVRGGASGVAGIALSILVGLGYVVATLCVVLGVVKLFAPDGVGAYRLESGALFIGIDENVQGVDLLGIWFSPLSIAAGVALYVLLTWAFGRFAGRKRVPRGPSTMED